MQYCYKNDELKKYLETKKCFKLICGANNENYSRITNLVALYSSLGVKFFDINASKEAIVAAKKGFEYSKNFGFICVSVGTKNDPHMTKCYIDKNKCLNCKKCTSLCPQGAINFDGVAAIIEKDCIGCKKCFNVCKNSAIVPYQKEINLDVLLDDIKEADCIEFHIISDNKEEIFEKWNYLTKNYNGYLSIALNRSLFSEKIMFDILNNMLKTSKSTYTMIQADGKSMSGGVDSYNSTLQAVSVADVILKQGFNAPVIISGGTNSKSFELAKLCDVNISGVAVGSYARNIVMDYIKDNDFLFDKEKFNKAYNIAFKFLKALGVINE